MADQSKFRWTSLGIVVEDKPPGTDYILVSPVEELNIQESGLIKDQSRTLKGTKKPTSGVNFDTHHQSKNYVRAKWFGGEVGNRTTAPDVCAGETVIISKFGDVDEYFWEDRGREPLLRKQEDVMYSFSNVKASGEAYDAKTSYWVRVNTREKYVHLHTSNNDGEAAEYDIRIDTANGYLSIEDNLGNSIALGSREGVIAMVATKEIIRKAPKITDISESHTVKTNTLINNASVINNNAPTVKNKGNVVTKGTDKARNQVEG